MNVGAAILFSSLQIVAADAPAPATQTRPALPVLPVLTEDSWIIVAGSKDPKEAEAQLADVKKRWPASIELSPGFPKIENSDGKKGLNPGFLIVLAGACTKESAAAEVRNELRKTFPGVYLRPVSRYLPGFIPDCPRLKTRPATAKARPKVPKGYELQDQGPAEKDGLVWHILTRGSQCEQSVLVQLLDKSGRLVDERTEDAHCVEGDPEEPGSGESKIWSAYITSDEGRPTRYVFLVYEQWASDTGCNGGFALCPDKDGISAEPLDGECTSSGYRPKEDEKHCAE